MARIKQLWAVVPAPAKLKLVWSRLTSSRLATFYFLMTVTHALIQVTFQLTALTVNANAASFLNELINVGGLQSRNFTLYNSKAGTLQSCWGIPSKHNEQEPCITIWAAKGVVVPSPKPAKDGYSAGEGPSTASTTTSAILSATSSVHSTIPSTSTPTLSPAATSTLASTLSPTTSSTIASTLSPTVTPSGLGALASPVADPSTLEDQGEDGGNSDSFTIDAVASIASSVAPAASPTAATNAILPQSLRKRNAVVTPIMGTGNQSAALTGLQIAGLQTADHDNSVDVSLQCVMVLRWPLQKLKDTEREDIVFVCFQIWVLGMSFVALLNESIPHIVAALLTHVLATMWSGFQLANTEDFRRNFINLTADGACKGVNLLPAYWKDRGVAEISMLVLNCVALVASALLSWRIVKVFGWATFRRIGADRKINRIYTVVLLMSIFLQLSLFFIVTSMALWIDQLCFGSIGIFSTHTAVYKALDIVIFFLLLPWLALGWFGVRKENKKMMYAFIGISIFLLVEWASEFLSDSWRLTFLTWDFFAIMSVVAAALTLAVTVLGVVCFLHFGEGLSNYLKPDEPLVGEDFQPVTVPHDVETASRSSTSSLGEKVAFPDSGSVPTYQMPFGSAPAPSEPSRGNELPAPLGSVKVQGAVQATVPAAPPRAQLNRDSMISTSTDESDVNPFHLEERLSTTSRNKVQSRWSKDSSEKSTRSGGHRTNLLGKRWVIE